MRLPTTADARSHVLLDFGDGCIALSMIRTDAVSFPYVSMHSLLELGDGCIAPALDFLHQHLLQRPPRRVPTACTHATTNTNVVKENRSRRRA
eukprot:COSAG01_NODE_48335_length_382_cov_0.872792_1_plen_92_part_10